MVLEKHRQKICRRRACVVINDNNAERLEEAKEEFQKQFGKDVFAADVLDVTKADTIQQTLKTAALAFGGVDIVVNNAGLSISKPIEEHTEKDWDLLYDVLVKGQFLVTKKALRSCANRTWWRCIEYCKQECIGSGPNNAGYGSAKAAQLHLARLNAAELGKDKIRVNVVNPDAVISDSKIWSGGWAEGRAKAYGITVEELPAYYAKRTLLNEII